MRRLMRQCRLKPKFKKKRINLTLFKFYIISHLKILYAQHSFNTHERYQADYFDVKPKYRLYKTRQFKDKFSNTYEVDIQIEIQSSKNL